MSGEQKKSQLLRIGAIGIFCGLPLLLIAASVSNVIDATQATDLATQERTTTALIVAQLEKHRGIAVKPVDTGLLYLTSTSDTLARAEIQDRVNTLVTGAGGRLAQLQLTATPEQEAAGTVAIQLTLNIDNKGLLNLLYTIESGLPLLDVTSLSVQRNNDQNNSGQTDDIEKGSDGVLHVDMTVQGHWRRSTG